MMNGVFPQKNSQDAQAILGAVIFLVTKMLDSGHNPKPVIFHSIRVGVYLYDLNYEPEIVKAGILHDIVEDSDTLIDDITKRFSVRVAEIVEANTFNYTLVDRATQGKDCIQRCLNYGRDALVVRVADKLENSYYLNLSMNLEFSKFWIGEIRYLVDVSQSILIGLDQPLWKDLSQQCQKLENALHEMTTRI